MKLLSVYIVVLNALVASAADWPQWRGPGRNAISNETGLLKSWERIVPETAWHATGIGEGYSGVVVSNGLAFTTGRRNGDVVCFALEEKTGEQKWERKIGTTSRNVMSTPTVDRGLVFAVDPDGELVCLNAADGKIVWQVSFTESFGGRLMSGRGYGESPLIDGDNLICTPGGADAMLVALNRRTGDVVWKTTIPDIGSKGRDGAAFPSIVVSEAAGIRQYVQLVGRGLIGVEAKTGRFLWGYNDICNQTANIPTPVVHGDYVFSANGYNAGCVLLQLKPDGNTGVKAEEVYRLRGSRFQNHHGGYALIGDHIFGGHGSNNGLPTCLEMKTGKVAWKRRGPGVGSASVIYADGHLYFHYQNGVVALIEASTEGYRLKGTFEIPGAGADSWAHPTIANGRLYLREKNDLWVYDLKRGRDPSRPGDPDAQALTGVLAELNELGCGLRIFDAGTAGPSDDVPDRERLYRIAVQSLEAKATRVPVVSIANSHLQKDGTISASVFKLCERIGGPFILSPAGTSLSNDGLQQVAPLKNLLGLNLELCRSITDAGYAALARSQSLAVVIATGTEISDTGLQHLTTVPNLVALDLEVCDNVSDANCGILAQMSALRGLVVKKTAFEPVKVTDKGLQQLSQLKKLELLTLNGNGVTNAGLKHLHEMPNLKELDLSLLAVSDDGLKELLPLSGLRRLELLYSEGFAGVNVTDAGLTSINKLTQLQSLNLIGAKISDTGLQKLQVLGGLRSLNLANARVTSDGVATLRAKLPKCEVIHGSGASPE